MTKESDLLEILDRGGVHSSEELAEELNCTREEVRRMVSRLRKQFLSADINEYIYSTKFGYTTDEKPEYIMFEARMCMAIGTSILLNGAHVFKRGKKLIQKDFNRLKIEYKPKLLEIGKL